MNKSSNFINVCSMWPKFRNLLKMNYSHVKTEIWRIFFPINWISWGLKLKPLNSFRKCCRMKEIISKLETWSWLYAKIFFKCSHYNVSDFDFTLLSLCMNNVINLLLTFGSIANALNFHKFGLIWATSKITYML